MRLPILIALLTTAVATRAAVVYEKEIAPILRTYCAGCHNDQDRENGFSVETVAALKKGGDDKRKAAEDMFWSLLTSREFLFQH